MHAARVIHFGADQAHRSQVLRSAGYEVEECATLPCLARVLRDGKVTDLICISEAQDQPAEGAVAFARGFDGTPLVLFRAANHAYLQRDWDLEVPTLTPPTEWLGEVAELIARSRTIRARPVGLQGNSRRLREVAEPALKRTRELRSDQERTRGGGRSQK
jgi:hypothetical protein